MSIVFFLPSPIKREERGRKRHLQVYFQFQAHFLTYCTRWVQILRFGNTMHIFQKGDLNRCIFPRDEPPNRAPTSTQILYKVNSGPSVGKDGALRSTAMQFTKPFV